MKYLQGLFLFFIFSFLSLSIEAQESNPLLNFDCLEDIDCVQQAIADGMDVKARARGERSYGATPLHIALSVYTSLRRTEGLSVIQALIDAGAEYTNLCFENEHCGQLSYKYPFPCLRT